jgi:hypothetical protein
MDQFAAPEKIPDKKLKQAILESNVCMSLRPSPFGRSAYVLAVMINDTVTVNSTAYNRAMMSMDWIMLHCAENGSNEVIGGGVYDNEWKKSSYTPNLKDVFRNISEP